MIFAHVIGRVRLDDIRAQLTRLAHQREDFLQVPIHHVATGLLIRAEDQRLDHQRQRETLTIRLQPQDVFDALIRHLRLAGDAEKIHHHARRIQPDRLLRRVADHPAEKGARQLTAIHIGHIRAQHQRRLVPARDTLQQLRLPDGELDRVRRRGHQRAHALPQILNAGQKPALIEEPVIHRHIETAARLSVEKAVEAKSFHARRGCCEIAPGTARLSPVAAFFRGSASLAKARRSPLTSRPLL